MITTTKRSRRSDRLMLTIPLRVRGVDANGVEFDIPARTVVLNRHGAQVKIPRKLQMGQQVRLVNLLGQTEAEFRVVRPISGSTQEGGDYGLEYVKPYEDIWQIQFSHPEDDEAADARALVECQICHRAALTRITLGELEALRTYGIVAKRCRTCNLETPVKFAEFANIAGEAVDVGWKMAFSGFARQRRHRRICLQLPLGIRDGQGGVEVARTENVSRGGFCFSSEKDYDSGQGVTVVYRGGTFGRNTEVPGQIVWREQFEHNKRKLYGIQCERLIPSREAARF
jgi:PilZ domain-containing protein